MLIQEQGESSIGLRHDIYPRCYVEDHGLPYRTEHGPRHLDYIPRLTQSIATHLPLPVFHLDRFRSSSSYDWLHQMARARIYVPAYGQGPTQYANGTPTEGIYFYTDGLPTYDMDRGDNYTAYVHGAQRRNLIEASPLRILSSASYPSRTLRAGIDAGID